MFQSHERFTRMSGLVESECIEKVAISLIATISTFFQTYCAL